MIENKGAVCNKGRIKDHALTPMVHWSGSVAEQVVSFGTTDALRVQR